MIVLFSALELLIVLVFIVELVAVMLCAYVLLTLADMSVDSINVRLTAMLEFIVELVELMLDAVLLSLTVLLSCAFAITLM